MTSARDASELVVWTRGKGCSELAGLLADQDPSRIKGDLTQECIDHRADLLVTRKVPGNFDLVNVVVPVDFEPGKVRQVVATVAGGPNSLLAAQTADRLSSALGVPAEMISAKRVDQDDADTNMILGQIGSDLPGLGRRVVEVDEIGDLVEDLGEGTLLVLGAPGGSWLQRSMLGAGARLRRTAQAGVVIVRSAPDRVFRFMGDPVFVAPLRHADDTLRFHVENTLAVADQGRLIGLVRRSRLVEAGEAPVGTLMEEAQSVRVDKTLAEASELQSTFGADPIPVTDHEEHLVGGLLLPVA